MTVYLAVWFIGVNEVIWLFVHEGLVSFCVLFAVLLAIVAGLMRDEAVREKRRRRGSLPSLYLPSEPGRYSEQLPRQTTQRGFSLPDRQYSTHGKENI